MRCHALFLFILFFALFPFSTQNFKGTTQFLLTCLSIRCSEFCFEFCFMGIEVSSLLTEGAFDYTLKSGSSDFQSNKKSEKGFRDGFC